MTKNNSNWGGKRDGAGRPRIVREHVAPLPQEVTEDKLANAAVARRRTILSYNAARAARSATEATVESLAATYSALAVHTLAEVALAGDKDASRVSASVALLRLAQGKGRPAGKTSEPALPDGWDDILQ